jgi:hypothetical protein
VGYLAGLLIVLLLAEIGLTWRFTIFLYYYLSFGIIALLIPVVVAPVFLGLYLEKHSDPSYRQAGKLFSKVFGYTALMQGVFYVTLVFMILGGLTVQSPDFSSATRFMFDWIMGSMYTSFLIYGLAGFMLFWSKHNFMGYFLCVCVLVYGWGGLVLVLGFEKEFQTWYYEHTTSGNILYFVSQLLFSFLYMRLMIFNKDIKKQKESQE